MTFNHFNRRLHLYLAIGLLPWFLMYGVSAIPFTRNEFFRELYNDGVPQWTIRFDRDYHRDIPDTGDLRPIARQILKDVGLEIEAGLGVNRNRQRLNIYLFTFWSSTRVTYRFDQHRLVAEDRRFRFDQFLTGLHARGGFQQDAFLNDAWAVLVDLVCIGFLVWIASGIYMWWQLPQTRRWGFLALGSGVLSFILFLVFL